MLPILELRRNEMKQFCSALFKVAIIIIHCVALDK